MSNAEANLAREQYANRRRAKSMHNSFCSCMALGDTCFGLAAAPAPLLGLSALHFTTG